MGPVKTVFNKSWIPYKNKVDFYVGQRVDFDAPVTTVHGFFFNDEGKLLLVKHKKRGWEIPGGHVEANEACEAAISRELYEEAQMYAEDLYVLGYLRKIALEDRPESCTYPYPLSYCIFYAAIISKSEAFFGDSSIIDFQFINVQESRKYSWIQSYDVYLEEALKVLNAFLLEVLSD